MLRLEEGDAVSVKAFQKLHSKAQKERFGRLFRSPTIWEDLLKSILLCNCG
jgi:predicted acetyltransferase